MSSVSIVIPAYNEGANLAVGIRELEERMKSDGIDHELILVDDGSSDNTWEQMLSISRLYPHIVCIRLSRNFGKEAAIFAGIAQAQHERCLVMDADMQHPPGIIGGMIRMMDETGANIVEGVKSDRGQESLGYKIFAKGFYKLLRYLSGIDLADSSDFKLFDRKVIDTVNSFRESTVFFRGLMEWSGFTREQYPFQVEDRNGGKSSFSTGRRMRFAVNSILSYTGKPLYFTVWAGVIFLLGAIALGIQTLVRFFLGQSVSGFTTVILLNLITGSLILLSLGIVGAYISRIFNEVKNRPRYIISENTRTLIKGQGSTPEG